MFHYEDGKKNMFLWLLTIESVAKTMKAETVTMREASATTSVARSIT